MWQTDFRVNLFKRSIVSVLTLSTLVGHYFVLDELSEDLVAASVTQAGDGGYETDWNYLMVFHPHLNLHGATVTVTNQYDQQHLNK